MQNRLVFIAVFIFTFYQCNALFNKCTRKCDKNFYQCISSSDGTTKFFTCNTQKSTCFQSCMDSSKRVPRSLEVVQASNFKHCAKSCTTSFDACFTMKDLSERKVCKRQAYQTCLKECVYKRI